MPTRINVSKIPLEANLKAKKFKHKGRGDLYEVFCRDQHTGDEYNVIVTGGDTLQK